jgi:two-component system, sensor histidine kinase PdtaS
MQSARSVQQHEARVHLTDAHNRVMSIATLQRMLATSREDVVPLRAYFTDLCRSIGASMIPDPKSLTLVATVDDSEVDADTSVSLGLIVTELVINALKHGYPGDDRKGRITVDYSAHGAGWRLVVADDGVGMPTGDAAGKPGLGTGIVDALSTQLEAIVTVSDAQPGTIVTVDAKG